MKKFLASILIFVVAISLCACDAKSTDESVAELPNVEHSTNQSKETESAVIDTADNPSIPITDEPLKVMGYVVEDVSDTDYIYYYVLVQNCTDSIIHTVSLDVLYLDSNGNIVDSSYPQEGVRVQPNQTIFIEGLVENGTADALTVDGYSFYTVDDEYYSDYFLDIPDSVSLKSACTKMIYELKTFDGNPVLDDCVLSDITDSISISNLRTEYSGSGHTYLYATITNNTDELIQDVTLDMICLDKNGNIINTTFPSLSARIRPNQSAQIDSIVEADKFAYFTIDGYSYYTANDEYVTGFLSVIPKASPLEASNIPNETESKKETISTEPETTETEPDNIPTEPEVVPTETQAMPTSNIAKETYDTMQSLTKDDCTINSLGQYVYNGLPLLDNSINKNGTIQASAIYRKMALCLEAFALGNNWESYAPFILGYVPNSRNEFADLVDDLSAFIVNSQPANSIRKKFQSMESVEVTVEENRYTISIDNLATTAKEMGISDEMMGHILCGMYDGGASISFENDGCIITYKDYWG